MARLNKAAHPRNPGDQFDWSAVGPQSPRGQPPGTITAQDFAARYGISTSGAHLQLKRLIAQGQLEAITFRQARGGTRLAFRVKGSK